MVDIGKKILTKKIKLFNFILIMIKIKKIICLPTFLRISVRLFCGWQLKTDFSWHLNFAVELKVHFSWHFNIAVLRTWPRNLEILMPQNFNAIKHLNSLHFSVFLISQRSKKLFLGVFHFASSSFVKFCGFLMSEIVSISYSKSRTKIKILESPDTTVIN